MTKPSVSSAGLATSRDCEICDAELTGRQRATCSTDCRKEAARRRARRWYGERCQDPEWYERRREKGREAHRRWAAANQEAALENARRWREANPDQRLEQERRWRAANAERVRSKNQRRRARLIDAFVEDVELDAIWERDRGTCQLCDHEVDRDLDWPDPMSLTIDHIVPLAKGGTHEPRNVQLAHARCNARKGTRAT